ncbi:MAG: ribosome biogenesis GTPase Der [Candidatus Brocadiales bacterium]
MYIPTVTIVGRPNVGKSSLLNCLAKRRISIVDPTSGVTRDRVSIEIEYPPKAGSMLEIVDTGGIGIPDADELKGEIETQIQIAIDTAHIILFVVDVREGVTPLDTTVAERLRQVNKPIILVANKVDSPKQEPLLGEFYKLGFDEPHPISATEGYGRSALLDKIVSILSPITTTSELPIPLMKLAIVGKRNVGKSTLINTLTNEHRVIVSEIPGTTRDSVDVRFELNGKTFIAIDTPGVRKKKQVTDSIEFYSMARAERSVRRADVVLFMLDAPRKISQVDKKLGSYIIENFKPCIIVVNKWDLAEGIHTGQFVHYIHAQLQGLSFAPFSFISAQDGQNVVGTINLAQELFKQANTRIPTAELNKAMEEAISVHRPTRKKNKMPKIYYTTQVSTQPPTFALFTNFPSLFDNDYKRYLANTLRKKFPFTEIPLKFLFRARKRSPSLYT